MSNNLPLNWCECKFSDLCDIYTGNSINEQEKVSKYTNLDSGYNYIGTKNVSFEQTIDYENGVKIPFDNGTFKIAPKNTPLLCIEGGSAGRKLAFTEEDICFGNKLCAFVSKNKITSLYIFYFLQSTAFRSIFSLNKNGLIGGVSLNKIKNLTFPLPPLAEQERIVEKIEALFQDIDEGVERLKSAQAQIKQYRQTILAKYYNYNCSTLCNLGDCFNIVNGDRGKNYPAKSKLNKIGIPFVSAINIKNGSLREDNLCCLSDKQYNLLGNGKINYGDTLLCIRGSIGKHCRYYKDKGAIASSMVILRKATTECQNQYLHYYLDSSLFTNEIKKYDNGTAQPNLSATDLRKFLFPNAQDNEQQRIVEEIEKRFAVADELEKAVNEGLEKADKLKQSILKKAFEGKLAPQNPNDEPASVLLGRIKKSQTPTKGKKK